MTFDRYANGLIGIADLWTETIEELDYIVFLNKLYRRITHVAHTHVTEAVTVAKVCAARLAHATQRSLARCDAGTPAQSACPTHRSRRRPRARPKSRVRRE